MTIQWYLSGEISAPICQCINETIYYDVYDDICSFENIWLATRKARLGKRNKKEVAEFEYDLERNIFEIQEQLTNQTYEFGKYREFLINEPKERLICAAPYKDRVVHHCICNVIEPLLDKAMIYNTYACRNGKGTHRAVDKAQEYLRNSSWVFKFDLKKYFFTIDHSILLEKIGKKIVDERLHSLVVKILKSYSSNTEYYFPMKGDGLFDILRPRGLPIGNLTSQLFANYFLNSLDRFISEKLGFKKYLRYMDDLLIFSDFKSDLLWAKNKVIDYLDSERLTLNSKKSNIFPSKHGISYLGFFVSSYFRRIRKSNLQRFKKRMLKYRKMNSNGLIDYVKIKQSLNAWYGFTKDIGNSYVSNVILSNIHFIGENKSYFFELNNGVNCINSSRVLRGGSWNNNAQNCRSANRNNNKPDNSNNNNGFRLLNT